MRFGKIRVEHNELRFTRMMKPCTVPCGDILWAYQRREETDSRMGYASGNIAANYLMILTKKEKRYQFEMKEEEARICLRYLKKCNPGMAIGFPHGAPIPARSVSNTRDLGGMKTADGRHILPCQLLRSGDLYHLSPEDVRLLREEYHLGMVLDFRTETEKEQRPDIFVNGSVYVDHPIFEEGFFGISRERGFPDLMRTEGNPEVYMMSMYQKLVLDGQSQHQYARFFQYLLENPEGRSILWHCSAGKDRVGIATMLLLSALGVPQDVIMEDYMRTNDCLYKDLEYFSRLMESRKIPPEKIEALQSILCAKECYLQSAVNTILAEYGTMERYLRRAMYLTARSLNRLKARYLV